MNFTNEQGKAITGEGSTFKNGVASGSSTLQDFRTMVKKLF